MSVIVKHMEMPDCCENCELNDHIDPFCRATGVDIDDENRISCRPSWCPLVELPEKHGRLIDADLFNYTLMFAAMSTREKLPKDFRYGMMSVLDAVKTQPTVVEAESES